MQNCLVRVMFLPLSAVPTTKLTKIRIQDVIKPALEESYESQSAVVKMEKNIANSKVVAAPINTKVNPHLTKPVCRNNNVKKKGKIEASSSLAVSVTLAEINKIVGTLSIAKPSRSKEHASISCTTPIKSCLHKEQLTPACSMPMTKSCCPKELGTPSPAAVSARNKTLMNPNIHGTSMAISVNSSEFSR